MWIGYERGLWVGGVPTPVGMVPGTGTGSFIGIAEGFKGDGMNPAFPIKGGMTGFVDFAMNQVSVNMNFDTADNITINNMTLSGNQFGGGTMMINGMSAMGANASGNLFGASGPTAIGGQFTGDSMSGNTFGGIFAGHQ